MYHLFVAAFSLQLLHVTTVTGQPNELPSVTNTSGGSRFHANYQFEWSIGELPSIQTRMENGVVLTEGFCQPLLTIGKYARPTWSNPVRVYPNPARNELYVQGMPSYQGMAEMVITDLAGHPLRTYLILVHEQWKEKIDISNLPKGKYFLKIYPKKIAVPPSSTGWVKL